MASDREVAGIRCMQVLARLDAFVDGELSPAEVEQMRAHVAGCTWCEAFGGRYATLVETLRQMDEPAEQPGEAAELARRLLRDRGPR